MEGLQIKKRLPAIEKSISDVQQSDIRVRLLGTVIDLGDSSLILDDGSGRIEVLFDVAPHVSVGERVRVVARILPLIDGFECRAEAFQKLDGFDIDLYRKAREIVKRV